MKSFRKWVLFQQIDYFSLINVCGQRAILPNDSLSRDAGHCTPWDHTKTKLKLFFWLL